MRADTANVPQPPDVESDPELRAMFFLSLLGLLLSAALILLGD
jgi:hypothetical protein